MAAAKELRSKAGQSMSPDGCSCCLVGYVLRVRAAWLMLLGECESHGGSWQALVPGGVLLVGQVLLLVLRVQLGTASAQTDRLVFCAAGSGMCQHGRA